VGHFRLLVLINLINFISGLGLVSLIEKIVRCRNGEYMASCRNGEYMASCRNGEYMASCRNGEYMARFRVTEAGAPTKGLRDMLREGMHRRLAIGRAPVGRHLESSDACV